MVSVLSLLCGHLLAQWSRSSRSWRTFFFRFQILSHGGEIGELVESHVFHVKINEFPWFFMKIALPDVFHSVPHPLLE